MKRQINEAVEKITEQIFRWDAVDTATLMATPDDLYDPYFFLSIDIYYRGELPGAEKRREAFSFAGAFETETSNRKDRFLMGDIPVRLEFKDIARFDEVVRGSADAPVSLRDSGTYMFYRLQNARILRKRSEWLTEIRGDIEHLRPEFWTSICDAYRARMEHFVSDLGASVIQDDSLFFLISAAGFIRSLCSLLFAVNRKFEPSGRTLAKDTLALSVLPESFRGRFDAFLRAESDVPRERKFEIAGLLAKSTLLLF